MIGPYTVILTNGTKYIVNYISDAIRIYENEIDARVYDGRGVEIPPELLNF